MLSIVVEDGGARNSANASATIWATEMSSGSRRSFPQMPRAVSRGSSVISPATTPLEPCRYPPTLRAKAARLRRHRLRMTAAQSTSC
jgi:hypothetical protein